ncbi:hypothetical protein ACLESO_25615 [Pyxidicoccus sp. 3LG]
MRTLVSLTFALGLLAGCGGSRSRDADDGPSVPAGGVCQSSSQCLIDYACAGCANEDAHCLPGCSTDADCSEGHCEQQQCITCPCPGNCVS